MNARDCSKGECGCELGPATLNAVTGTPRTAKRRGEWGADPTPRIAAAAHRTQTHSAPLLRSPTSQHRSFLTVASAEAPFISQDDDAYALCGFGAGHHRESLPRIHPCALIFTNRHVAESALHPEFLSRRVRPRHLHLAYLRTTVRLETSPSVCRRCR